jgi:hypothetical protein
MFFRSGNAVDYTHVIAKRAPNMTELMTVYVL